MHLWNKNGDEIFFRHKRNCRAQNAVVNRYVTYFLKNGLVKDGRSGRYAGVPTTTDRATWRIGLMGGATFMQTTYKLIKENSRHLEPSTKNKKKLLCVSKCRYNKIRRRNK